MRFFLLIMKGNNHYNIHLKLKVINIFGLGAKNKIKQNKTKQNKTKQNKTKTKTKENKIKIYIYRQLATTPSTPNFQNLIYPFDRVVW